MFPLLGLFVWFLFVAAAWASPFALGLSAIFAADHAGTSGATSFLIGVGVLVATVAAGRMILTLLPERGPARMGFVLLFALPAAVATALVGGTMSRDTGVDQWAIIAVAVIGAVFGEFAGVRVLEQPAI